MAIDSDTFYWAICDECYSTVTVDEPGDHMHFTEEEALKQALDYGWEERDGNLICPECLEGDSDDEEDD